MSLSLDLSEFANLSEKRMSLIARKSFIDVSGDAIEKTPRKTGRARSNWLPSIGSKSSDITDDTTSKNKQEIKKIANTFKLGDTLYLTNNLGYIIPLEYGHSKQAPGGMLRISVARFNIHVKQAVTQSKTYKWSK